MNKKTFADALVSKLDRWCSVCGQTDRDCNTNTRVCRECAKKYSSVRYTSGLEAARAFVAKTRAENREALARRNVASKSYRRMFNRMIWNRSNLEQAKKWADVSCFAATGTAGGADFGASGGRESIAPELDVDPPPAVNGACNVKKGRYCEAMKLALTYKVRFDSASISKCFSLTGGPTRIAYSVPAIGRGRNRSPAINLIFNRCPFCEATLNVE